LKGKIPLYHASVSDNITPKPDRANAFQCITKDRTFVMAAASPEELKSWVEHIRHEIDTISADIDSITLES